MDYLMYVALVLKESMNYIMYGETKHQKVTVYGEALREGKSGSQGRRTGPQQANPPGVDKELGAGQ